MNEHFSCLSIRTSVRTLSTHFAFSLIELLISLIVISCITAAFTPVITKKLKTSAVALNAADSKITPECAEKFSSFCKLCTESYCIQCELSNCAVGKYVENKTCSCKDCSSLFSDCVECSATKCTKCQITHYIKDGKCEICPTDKICDGINAYDASYCTNPPDGYFCESNILKRCTEKYDSNCTACNQSQCTKCGNFFFLSGSECKRCGGVCMACLNEQHCTLCQNNFLLNPVTHKCETQCKDVIDNCVWCSDKDTCTKCNAGYYINSSKKCSSCSETITNCISCTNGTTCTKCKKDWYVNSSNTCSQCTVANCAQCDRDGSCLSCNQGYHLSPDKKCIGNDDKFNCSDSNFMQIGNLCVTRRNMGDSTMLPIPSTVSVATGASEYCYPQTTKCCWKSEIPSDRCNSSNGSYSGCKRTACNWDAAKEICSKFTYGGKIWRLPTSAEMANWGYNSDALGDNGLMLCGDALGLSSSYCPTAAPCSGPPFSTCYTYYVWGAESLSSSSILRYTMGSGQWESGYSTPEFALSVRCVTEME